MATAGVRFASRASTAAAGHAGFTFAARLRYIPVMTGDLQIVLCTVPDRGCAEQIARTLVAESLAACVNIVPEITSVYRWKGNIENDPELLLIIKTGGAVFAALRDRIQALHPYELPEVIAVPVTDGLPAYLDWMTTACAKPR